MYASEGFPNVIYFPSGNKSRLSTERLTYSCQLTIISRKYAAQIEKEFRSVCQLFSLIFDKIGEPGYETFSIFSSETLVISYVVCTEFIIGSTHLKELDFLYQAVQKYPKVFDGDSIVAFLIRAIESPNFLEKR